MRKAKYELHIRTSRGSAILLEGEFDEDALMAIADHLGSEPRPRHSDTCMSLISVSARTSAPPFPCTCGAETKANHD